MKITEMIKRTKQAKREPQGPVKPRFVFQWHITDACDQRCRHCYIYAEDSGKAGETMGFPEMRQVLANCLDFCDHLGYAPYFCITGGDPLLHPRFWDLAELLSELKIPFSILGNPFHLTDKVCRRLKKLGCKSYQLSIDGLEATHDALRKPGSYRETVEKIAMLNAAGLHSAVMTTVSRLNMDELPAVIEAMAAAKAGTYAFSRYCPTGADKDVGIAPEEYKALLARCAETIRGLLNQGCTTVFGKKDHLWTLYDYERGAFKIPEDADPGVIYGGCHCGQSHLTLLPNGDVYACRRVLNSKVGNALTDDLDLIWAGPMEAYRHYDQFRKCAGCELMPWCRGCPAVASAKDGDFYAPDPQCWKAE